MTTKNLLRFIALSYLLAAAAVIGSGLIFYHQSGRITEVNHRLQTKVCTLESIFRDKAQKDMEGAQGILNANPDGVPGFPPSTIRAAIKDDQDQIDRVSDSHCPPPPKPTTTKGRNDAS